MKRLAEVVAMPPRCEPDVVETFHARLHRIRRGSLPCKLIIQPGIDLKTGKDFLRSALGMPLRGISVNSISASNRIKNKEHFRD
jgi:hypothetical protein